MNKKIIEETVEHEEYEIFNWQEKRQPQIPTPAGIELTELKHQEAEYDKQNPMLGDVCFECDKSLKSGTVFSIKGERQRFTVGLKSGNKQYANRLIET